MEVNSKLRFVTLLSETNRSGVEKLLEWLDKTNFYTSPASTKYHGAVEGGLLAHSLAVYDELLKVNAAFCLEIKPESMVITALLHDLNKANFYTVSERNVKNDAGVWEKVPYYTIDDQLPMGHGEKSVILLQAFIRPTIEEIMAIRWHMGAFGSESYADRQALTGAMDKYPIIVALQIADMASVYFGKK